jgi:hypothetical protein
MKKIIEIIAIPFFYIIIALLYAFDIIVGCFNHLCSFFMNVPIRIYPYDNIYWVRGRKVSLVTLVTNPKYRRSNTKIIGVLAPYQKDFNNWIYANAKLGESYVRICNECESKDIIFDRIEKTDEWYKVDRDLIKLAYVHLKK